MSDMSNRTRRFVQIATILTDRISELLYAPVLVTDEQGVVITSSEPSWAGLDCTHPHLATLVNGLRIPLRHEAAQGEVIVGVSPNQEAISPRLAQAIVELVIAQTATQNWSPSPSDLKNQFIQDVLFERIPNEGVLLQRAKQLGIDFNPPRAVILIDAAEYILQPSVADLAISMMLQQQRTQRIISSIVSFFHLPNDTICTELGEGIIAVLKASDSKNLDHWAEGTLPAHGGGSSWANLTALKRAADALLLRLHSDTGTVINVGVGRYHPGMRGLAKSYEDARAALSLGIRFQGNNRVHCLGELGIAAFVGIADEDTKIDLAKYLLSPLDDEPELLTTLNTFFTENCCSSSTARELSIHRNTLSYRLDKIASLTGLDPRKFDHAVQMRLCLLLRSLQSLG
ncbi:MAG: helix-turn-helix domain-containing protein [Synechococcales cyanobacterium M58_A2018_015]|nr:helix-turn-helix domain-containing protein [Synechococcales cyanobacterium M58_A2018_015]